MKLPQVAALVDRCDIVVCPDSSMLHLAGALGKKIVSVFGPIPPASRINHYANAIAVTKNLPCQYCWYTPRCIKSEGHKLDCLVTVTAEEVADAVMKKLAAPYNIRSSLTYGKDLTDANQDNVIMIRRSTDGMGDLLMTTPTIEAIAKKYPNMDIEVACQRKLWPVLENNPYVSKLVDISENFNPRRYFLIADISTPCARYESTRVLAGKPVQKSRVEIYAEACGVRDSITSLKPRYYVRENESQWADAFIKQVIPNKTKPLVAVGFRSAEQYRDWPEENFQELFTLLKDHADILLLDHSREHMYTDVIDACGFSLRNAIALLSKCDYLLTVDTSLLHFAAALNIPTIALFGPIDYKSRCKGYDNITVIKSDMTCIPCWRNSRIPCAATGLVRGYSKCMSAIKPKHVAANTIDRLAIRGI
jgi:ADP-heptose:LPS heptosyltransferase